MRRMLLLAGACTMLSLLAVFWGTSNLSIHSTWNALWDGPGGNSLAARILWDLRMPRALTAMLAGSALAVSGLELQTLLRNPLAGPHVLGVTSGATLGIAVVLLVGGVAGASMLTAAAVGAGAVLAGILIIARRLPGTVSLVVAGMMAGFLVDAAVQVLLHGASAERVQAFVGWTFGSFSRSTWDRMPLLTIPLLLGGLAALFSIKYLDATLLGEDTARLLGIPVRLYRPLVLGGASLLAATTTVCCGPIAFIGLAVPNLARAYFRTSSHRILLPACALAGASLALLASILSQLPQGGLPINAVTALLGAPVVLWVLLRKGAAL